MDRRWTDIAKWKKPFIKALPPEYKLLWLYICDDCNKAGVWDVDIDIAQIRIGCPNIDEKKAIELFGKRIKVMDGGEKWWIVGFCKSQYKELNEEYNLHKGVIKSLQLYGLWADYQSSILNEPW